MKVTFRVLLETYCPNVPRLIAGTNRLATGSGRVDKNQIYIEYDNPTTRVDAEVVVAQCDHWKGATIYAEELARELFAAIEPKPDRLRLVQIVGHGVDVELP